IAELGLATRVLWTDYVSAQSVSANLMASDICVLPYRDGASFRRGSFMAALAHGLPIVTTSPLTNPPRSPRAAEVGGERVRGGELRLPPLRDRENVLLVPADDPPKLAEGIEELLTFPQLGARLSQGAKELAEHFGWDKIAAQHLALYLRVTGHTSPASAPSAVRDTSRVN